MAKKPVLLCIMDGFGWVPEQTFGNAIHDDHLLNAIYPL